MTTTKELLTKHNVLATRLGKPILKVWKDKKAKLEARIDAMVAELEPKEDTKKAAKGPAPEGLLSIADIARSVDVNPKVARAKLRRLGDDAPLAVENGRYPKVEKDSDLAAELAALFAPDEEE